MRGSPCVPATPAARSRKRITSRLGASASEQERIGLTARQEDASIQSPPGVLPPFHGREDAPTSSSVAFKVAALLCMDIEMVRD